MTAEENGKLLNIVQDIQLDVRETRGDVKSIAQELSKVQVSVAAHDTKLTAHGKSIQWLYWLIGGSIIAGIGVIVGWLRP